MWCPWSSQTCITVHHKDFVFLFLNSIQPPATCRCYMHDAVLEPDVVWGWFPMSVFELRCQVWLRPYSITSCHPQTDTTHCHCRNIIRDQVQCSHAEVLTELLLIVLKAGSAGVLCIQDVADDKSDQQTWLLQAAMSGAEGLCGA